jgi:hypothetical protein
MNSWRIIQDHAPEVGGKLLWKWQNLVDDPPVSFRPKPYGDKCYMPRETVQDPVWAVYGFKPGVQRGLNFWDARRALERLLRIAREKGVGVKEGPTLPSGHFGYAIDLDAANMTVLKLPMCMAAECKTYVEPSRERNVVHAWFLGKPKIQETDRVKRGGLLDINGSGYREPFVCAPVRRHTAQHLERLLDMAELLS